MLKPAQQRKVLTDCVPHLQTNPDSLNMFVDSGRIVSTLAASLSFEDQYQLSLVITDYPGNVDLLIVPILAWLRENQPDIMATEEKRRTDFTHEVDIISDTLIDISIKLQLTERVIVKQVDGGLHVDRVPEPPLPDDVSPPTQLYLSGQLISEWL
ncbi:phage tail protein [Erwinia pyri]|uniref:Phage tail protein n=1 Tax=Erwinia pyri TaxID=3062598 RepID=A0AA50HNN6_9GAMM|nr:phage tail protein [Erwinia sp. DE2]WLS77150.1 phage tail protein [Erwinia sp. DE2]